MLGGIDILKTGEPVPEGIKPKAIWDLVLSEGHLPRVPYSFDGVQKFIQREVGGTLPKNLTDNLTFNTQAWQLIFDQHAMPLLFVGVPEYREGDIRLSEAMGTIEVCRIVQQETNNVVVSELRVAGVGKISTHEERILAASFSAKTHRVTNLAVSITEKEFPQEIEVKEADFFGARMPICLNPLEVHTIAGLVTRAMIRATENEEREPQLSVLRVNNLCSRPENLEVADHGTLSSRLGFKVKSSGPESPAHYIVYTPPSSGSPMLREWSAEFPKTLAK